MPAHNTATAKGSAAGGAARSAGGKKLGKKAARAVVKGGSCVDSLLDMLESGRVTTYLTLGRVERVYGGSHFEVRFLEGGRNRLGLGGNIRGARGGCCVSLHDFVVVDGGMVKGCLSAAETVRAKRAVTAAGMRVERNFFAVATEDGDLRVADDDLFDYSDEERIEAQQKSALRERMAREAALRAIPAGKQQKIVVAVAAAEPAVEEADDDEEEPSTPQATGGVAAPVKAGPNRADRRAAARALAEAEEARREFELSKAAELAYQYQLETGDLGSATWDEVDIDAI